MVLMFDLWGGGGGEKAASLLSQRRFMALEIFSGKKLSLRSCQREFQLCFIFVVSHFEIGVNQNREYYRTPLLGYKARFHLFVFIHLYVYKCKGLCMCAHSC